jgi:hypothetical protein
VDEKALFTDFWTKESKTTSKVIARIPEGSDYKPDPRSRTAQQIAWQIVCEEKMIVEARALLRPRPLGVGDGVELLVRHRPSSGPDQHVFAPDGINGPADLWA